MSDDTVILLSDGSEIRVSATALAQDRDDKLKDAIRRLIWARGERLYKRKRLSAPCNIS